MFKIKFILVSLLSLIPLGAHGEEDRSGTERVADLRLGTLLCSSPSAEEAARSLDEIRAALALNRLETVTLDSVRGISVKGAFSTVNAIATYVNGSCALAAAGEKSRQGLTEVLDATRFLVEWEAIQSDLEYTDLGPNPTGEVPPCPGIDPSGPGVRIPYPRDPSEQQPPNQNKIEEKCSGRCKPLAKECKRAVVAHCEPIHAEVDYDTFRCRETARGINMPSSCDLEPVRVTGINRCFLREGSDECYGYHTQITDVSCLKCWMWWPWTGEKKTVCINRSTLWKEIPADCRYVPAVEGKDGWKADPSSCRPRGEQCSGKCRKIKLDSQNDCRPDESIFEESMETCEFEPNEPSTGLGEY